LFATVVSIRFVDPENAGAFAMKYALTYQIVDSASRQEGRIELKQRLGPEGAGIEFGFHLRRYSWICDLNETSRIACIVGNKTISKLEYVHDGQVPPKSASLKGTGKHQHTTKAILNWDFVRLGQKTRPHFPFYGAWGLAFVLYGAFVSNAFWISKRVKERKT
jgi:hypothetical protein